MGERVQHMSCIYFLTSQTLLLIYPAVVNKNLLLFYMKEKPVWVPPWAEASFSDPLLGRKPYRVVSRKPHAKQKIWKSSDLNSWGKTPFYQKEINVYLRVQCDWCIVFLQFMVSPLWLCFILISIMILSSHLTTYSYPFPLSQLIQVSGLS